MREQFLQRYSSTKTRAKYQVIFRKFDSFLNNRLQTEQDFITKLQNSQTHDRYNILQELTFFLQETLSPRSTGNYFDSIFKYLLYAGCDLNHEQLRLRVQFPRVNMTRPDGLDRAGIGNLLSFADRKMNLYMRVLAASGLREGEALQLTPKHIEFDLFGMEEPARVDVTSDIAKFGIRHETFISYNTSMDLLLHIRTNKISDSEYIFVKKYDDNTVSSFDHAFETIRAKAGLDTQGRAKHAKNDIRLHSLRSWFITTWMDMDKESFGRALAGHSQFLTIYYRKSPAERLRIYKENQALFDF